MLQVNKLFCAFKNEIKPNRAPLGCDTTGELHHRCAADKSAATA